MNNKAKVIKLSVMFFLTFITLVTVTFAWFVAMEKTIPVVIESGTLRVSATLYFGVDKNNNDTIEEDEYNQVENSLSFSDVIPGRVYPFKLVITNNGTIDGNLSVSIINILYSDEKIKSKFKIEFVNPATQVESIILIDSIDEVLFEEYKLDSKTTFNFYFQIVAGEDITTELNSHKIVLSSFLIKLDQIRE